MENFNFSENELIKKNKRENEEGKKKQGKIRKKNYIIEIIE
jgi:hypothetical protein